MKLSEHRTLLLFGLPTVLVAAVLGIWLSGGRTVSTENAYVKAHILQIAPEVSGRVVEVSVVDHSEVAAGDVLFRIDPEPYRLALARADAELDQARSQVATFRAALAEAKSELAEAETKIVFLDQQVFRQRQLSTRGVGFAFKLEEAESAATGARDHVGLVRQRITRALAALGGNPDLPTEQHGMVKEKQAARDRAALELDRTVVKAPVSGITVNVKLQNGEQVRVATPVFAMVSSARPWIEANFKETDLGHVRPGQRASVVLDIYPDVTWEAVVESISPAAGSEFAILPPQNASGNWVKVVQRLPVRLRLVQRPNEPPLRAGMTASVSIDTGRPSRFASLLSGGPSLAGSGRP